MINPEDVSHPFCTLENGPVSNVVGNDNTFIALPWVLDVSPIIFSPAGKSSPVDILRSPILGSHDSTKPTLSPSGVLTVSPSR